MQLVLGPLLGLGKLRRAGQALANIVKQSAGIFHDVGVLQAFIANTRNSIEIELFGRSGLYGGRLPGRLGGRLSVGLVDGEGANGYEQDDSGYFHT